MNEGNLLVVILTIATLLTIFIVSSEVYKKTRIHNHDPDLECGTTRFPKDLDNEGD
jgi:hypothetical protein